MAEKCKECGCACTRCSQGDQSRSSDMHLHVEIENLRQRLLERDSHIVTMETQFLNDAEKFPNGELASIKEEILTWQEKYSRLYEAHKRVQKVNQNLEDKLLRIVDKCETEKGAFAKDVATLSHRLADANYTIRRLTQDNEKYRNDVNLAIQLLQCKPSNFIGQKYDSLPSEVQTKVKMYVTQKRRTSEVTLPDVKSITVPISTFPPTAMVYNVTRANVDKDSDNENDESKPPVDIVSAAIMAKVLEDREKERIFAKHCDTCTCHRSILTTDNEVQTTTDLSYFCNVCKSCGTTDNVQVAIELRENVEEANRNRAWHYECNDNSFKRSTFRGFHENTADDCKSKVEGNVDSNSDVKHRFDFQRTSRKEDCGNVRSTEGPRIIGFKCVDSKGCSNVKGPMHQYNSIGVGDGASATRSNACRGKALQNRKADKREANGNADDESAVNLPLMDGSRLQQKQKIESTARPTSQLSQRHGLDNEPKCTSDWYRVEGNSSCRRYFVDARDNLTEREQGQLDVVDERLRRNEWTMRKDQLNVNDVTSGQRKRTTGGEEVRLVDVINDRIWKNDRSRLRDDKSARLTLIEVTGGNRSITKHAGHGEHTENVAAASPSISSDSIIVSSTSDPPSSCSDSVQPIKEERQEPVYNNSESRSVTQDRTTGPRNCLMRVTPGSRNILLDNTGHYQTVLHTSGPNNDRPSTALVHAKKSSLRSGRSTSISSEENSPSTFSPPDDVQLQRVAEWIRASGPANRKTSSSGNVVASSSSTSKLESESKAQRTTGAQAQIAGHDSRMTRPAHLGRRAATTSAPYDDDLGPRDNGDLITFDLSSDEISCADQFRSSTTKADSASELNYEVKITREMEETYLKLAASLDPVTLRLSSSTSADLTIEKYRRDHKRLNVQKIGQDKSGSTT